MKDDLLNYLRCPQCQELLDLIGSTKTDENATENITLHCVGCHQQYKVINGIPRFVPEDNYASNFGFQWNKHAKAQIDKFSGLAISRDRFYGVTKWQKNLEGQMILEAGSGAGRFTQIACETNAKVFSFDYSNAVEANQSNNGSYPNLNLFQGNIYHIPLQKEAFDKVFCFGVLQHTPDVKKTFFCLTEYVKPGGSLAVDVYGKTLGSLLSWKYLLRPITTRIDQKLLYNIIAKVVPKGIPVSRFLQKLFGKIGRKLVPFKDYSYLSLPEELCLEWSILDTFDNYSPKHDHPQTVKTLRTWFEEAAFEDIVVERGPNGVIGRGKKPSEA